MIRNRCLQSICACSFISYAISHLARMRNAVVILMVLAVSSVTIPCLAQSGTPTLKLLPAAWTQVNVVQGASAIAVISVTSGGSFQGNVSLTITGLPSGVTASWSSDPVTLTSGVGASTLTLTASATAQVSSTTFTVTASGDSVSNYQNYTVQVQHAPAVQLTSSLQSLSMWSMSSDTVTVTATPIGAVTVPSGAAGASVAIVSGLPTGITASWSNPTVTAAGAVSWTLTLTGSVYAVASSGILNVSAQITDASTGNIYTSSLGIPLTVSFNAPTLSFSPASTHVPITQGAQITDLFTFTSTGSFHGAVTLTITGLPSGVTASWSNAPVTLTSVAGSSTLTLAASATAQVSSTAFTVTASGDGLTVSKNYTVQVLVAPAVQLTSSHQSLSMGSMSSDTVTVTATPIGAVTVPSGAAGASVAIVSGLPTGITAAWSSPTVTAAGAVSWTLTLTGSVYAVASSGALNVSAQITDANTGNIYTSSVGIPLTVSFTPPTLSFSPALTHVPITQGAQATDLFSFTSGGSFQGNVTLAITGLPSGVSASWSNAPITLTSGAGSSTLTLTASATAQVSSTTFTVTATGDGLTVSKNYTVQVLPAPAVQLTSSLQSLSMWSMSSDTVTVTATPIGAVTVPSGAAGASVAIVSGLPTGITASWSNPTVTAAGAVSWTLTLTGSVYAVASSGALNVSAQITDASTGNIYTSSLGIPLTVSFNAPTLSFSPASTHVPVIQGAQATDLFTFTSTGSFHGAVTLTISGLPSFVTASWSSDPVTLASSTGSSTLTLAPSATATVNAFMFTVTASGDGLTVSRNYTVEVEPAIGVQAQLSNSALTIEPQGTATLSVTATPVNGIVVPAGAAGANAAVVSGLPGSITASWSNPTVTAAGAVNWTLTLTADGTAQTGSDPIDLSVQITDGSSGLVYSASPNFTLLVSLLANVSIGSTPGTTIPATFMGLSHEWGDAQNKMGNSTTGVNPIYRQLLTNLTCYGSVPINLRIGGNSTDVTGEPTSTTVTPFAQLATALGATFELGVNLGSDNVGLAVDQATAYVSQMPAGSVDAIEIGNEPDLYPQSGMRSSTYDFQNYLQDFNTWEDNIMPVLPAGVKLAGPAGGLFISPPTAEIANVQAYLSDESSVLSLFTQHYYSASPANNPAADFLLTPAAATAGPSWLAPAVQAAHSYGIPYRVDELGAISNGGVQGVSNTFAAALWAVDTMFEYANVGVDGVNWEASNGNYNDPFYFTTSTSNGVTTYTLNPVNPIYYGLLFFQVALGDGAQMLPVDLTTPANLTAWATVPASRSPRLAIINKDETLAGNVSISMPGYSQATVLLLTAPSYTSTAGVTFAGQTLDGSLSGKLQGTKTEETLEGTDGVFQIPMSITSAALVIFTN